MNDIQTFSSRADRVTNGASRRVEQFKRSFYSVFAGWLDDVLTAVQQDSRQCLRNKFWDDNPSNLAKECIPVTSILYVQRKFPFTLYFGTLKKSTLGADCALDLTSVDDICVNMRRFLKWATEDCRQGDRRLGVLDRKCEVVRGVQARNQAAASGQRKTKGSK